MRIDVTLVAHGAGGPTTVSTTVTVDPRASEAMVAVVADQAAEAARRLVEHGAVEAPTVAASRTFVPLADLLTAL